MNVQFYIPEDLLTLIIKIPVIIGGTYIFYKCVGWKFSWIDVVMITIGVIVVEFTDNIWKAIGIMCGIVCGGAIILGTIEYICDEGKGRKYEQQLINMLMGDEETAERLIKYEEEQNPCAFRSKHIAAAIERLQQDQRSWDPGEPVKHWRPEPEQETQWGWGIAGWIIVIAAICLVGGKIWQQHQEEAQQARMVQPAPQMQPHQIQTPTQELCWIDGNGRKIYSNTVPQGKGIQPCP